MTEIKTMCRMAIVAALYVALCTLNPLSFGPLQFRIANILVALPLLNRKYAPSILLGVALANSTSPIGPMDVLFGVTAEGIGYALCIYGPFKALPVLARTAVISASVALIVGFELKLVYMAPYALTALGLLVTTMAAISMGYMIFGHSPLQKIL